jgi:hypothetical protein
MSSRFPLRSWTNTNFVMLTTSTEARWAMPSHLGGFTSKSNKCATNDRRSPTSAQGLVCSLLLNLSPQITHLELHSQREGWGELSNGLGCVFEGLEVSRSSRGGWVYIHPHPKLAVGAQKLAVMVCTGVALLARHVALLQSSTATHCMALPQHSETT